LFVIPAGDARAQDLFAEEEGATDWIAVSALDAEPGAAEGSAAAGEAAEGGSAGPSQNNLLDLDIDQLGKVDVVVPSFNVEVSSVTRSESTVGKSPAAVFVVTQEMIRRSGATSIPEVLRMVPGLQVAKIDANKWTVSSRGFNGFTTNKTLVLVDGRSVYSPLFSGTLFASAHWDQIDVVLQDVERIEVVRGPGGTLWGANAVNGVINIVTKNAKDTQGMLYSGGGGSDDKAINAVRYGDSIGTDFHYRIYYKQFERDESTNTRLRDLRHGNIVRETPADDWRQQRIGFRADWNVDNEDIDTMTLQGDFYDGTSGIATVFSGASPPFEEFIIRHDNEIQGADLIGRWTHKIDDESSVTLQAYYDFFRRNNLLLHERTDIFDLELTHRFPLNDHNLITWGGRYRFVTDDLAFPTSSLQYDPSSRQTNLYSLFVQDQVPLIPDTLDLMFGTIVEHNDFSGFEIQPSTRLLWTIDDRQVAWGAVSRGVRTPSRVEDDLQFLLGVHNHANINGFNGYLGNRDVEAENVVAYELGYRAQPIRWFSWDVAGFYNDYSDLIAFRTLPLIVDPPRLIAPLVFDNAMSGRAYGAEITATCDMTEDWQIMVAYSYLQILLDIEPNVERSLVYEDGIFPHNQVYVQSSWDLPCHLEFDLMGRFVDKLKAAEVRGYIELNARLAYRPNSEWEFSVVGQNLLNPSHREFEQILTLSNRVDRGVYAQVVWQH